MIPKKTNYSQAIIDTIDSQEIERSSKLANKGITDNELKSETFISTKRKQISSTLLQKKLQQNRLFGYSANEFK